MKKLFCAANGAALVLGAPAGLAHADAKVEKGKGLSVDRAGGWMDGHGASVRARLYAVRAGVRTDVTRWKDATPVSAGVKKFSNVDWKLRGRRFSNGTWLCIEFNKTDDRPCAKIHR